jgi:hypothetical protein
VRHSGEPTIPGCGCRHKADWNPGVYSWQPPNVRQDFGAPGIERGILAAGGLRIEYPSEKIGEAQLIFTALAELSTRQIAETAAAVGLPAIKKAAKTGGKIAQRARLELESKTGRKVVTGENYLPPSKSKKGLKA